MQRRLAAIVAADVVAYSKMMRIDEEGTLKALKALREALIGPKIAAHGGRIVKLMGDGILAEFASAVDAVVCSSELQQAIARHNRDRPETARIVFRMGTNLGDVVVEGEDIHGDGVNLAARLEGLAAPGGICISAGVYEEVRDRLDLTFEDLGERQLKNIDRPLRAWRWPAAGADTAKPLQGDPDTAPPAEMPAIAVLPFTNLSGDPAQEYFADGITEDIIAEMSRFRSLRVIARNTSFAYKGKAAPAQEVGRDLKVAYIVEGSLRRSGKRVRVSAQLSEAGSGRQLWTERYDRDLEDIFAVQDEITRSIAAAVVPELSSLERERSRLKSPGSLTAWEWYQRGLWYHYQDTKASNAEALRHLAQAIELSPDFAPAYAASANVLAQNIISGYRDISDTATKDAYQMAEKAVALDDKDALAHMVLGRIALLRCQHENSLAELERAVALNPSFAEGYHGLGFSLIFSGRPEDAVPLFDTAIRLSPFDPSLSSFYEMRAWALLVMGRFEEAAASARISVRRPNAQHWAYATLSAALGHLGCIDEAKQALEEVHKRKADFSQGFVRRFVYYDRSPAHLDRYIEGLAKAGLPA